MSARLAAPLLVALLALGCRTPLPAVRPLAPDDPRPGALIEALLRQANLVHSVRGDGFAWFRDVLLSIQPLIALLKHGEQIGFYIDSSEPLFVEGLGLDSIDALEIAMVLEQRYGVAIEDDAEANRERFASVKSLAAFVADNRSL